MGDLQGPEKSNDSRGKTLHRGTIDRCFHCMYTEEYNELRDEEFYLLGYNAMYSTESQPMFWRNISPPPAFTLVSCLAYS
jgi:hypothetical protein